MTEVQLSPELECKRCHHKWIPRQKTVKVCPHCKSPWWDTPPKNKLPNDGKIYARPHGSHYHQKRDCRMLEGDQFEKLGYQEITPADIRKRKLIPCTCARSPKRNNDRKEEKWTTQRENGK